MKLPFVKIASTQTKTNTGIYQTVNVNLGKTWRRLILMFQRIVSGTACRPWCPSMQPFKGVNLFPDFKKQALR